MTIERPMFPPRAKQATSALPLHGPFSAASSSKEAIRARIALIGSERGLSQAEIEPALKANTQLVGKNNAILKLAEDHDISLDWLMLGDLRGLLRMRRPSSTW